MRNLKGVSKEDQVKLFHYINEQAVDATMKMFRGATGYTEAKEIELRNILKTNKFSANPNDNFQGGEMWIMDGDTPTDIPSPKFYKFLVDNKERLKNKQFGYRDSNNDLVSNSLFPSGEYYDELIKRYLEWQSTTRGP